MTRSQVATIMASILVGAGLAAACTAPDIEPSLPPIGSTCEHVVVREVFKPAGTSLVVCDNERNAR